MAPSRSRIAVCFTAILASSTPVRLLLLLYFVMPIVLFGAHGNGFV